MRLCGVAGIFAKHKIKATFNFNSDSLRCYYTKEDMNDIFFSKGHEIAIHGANHRANGNMRPIEGIRDVLDCRLELEENPRSRSAKLRVAEKL